MYEHVFLVVHIPVQNKQWALGSGFMKDDVLVVLLWTEKKKKKVSPLAFWILSLVGCHGKHSFGSFVNCNSSQDSS
jgi:lipid-A-disaccharide synthase-like uncharacterized protein